MSDDVMNFDYEKNLKGIQGLERLAKRYKRDGDKDSLREVVRLLVASSGHDIHEIRNRANVILERVFALRNMTHRSLRFSIISMWGEEFQFEFTFHENGDSYALRVYRNASADEICVEPEISFKEFPLVYDSEQKKFTASVLFEEYGHYDFAIIKTNGSRTEWLTEYGTSGRVNVIPDLRGELVIEIFTDIHGHSKIYWQDESGHPGLVYNENGEIIRLGRFSDITAHLEDMQLRYSLTALYILGAQRRGTNREDWASEASSPSPFFTDESCGNRTCAWR